LQSRFHDIGLVAIPGHLLTKRCGKMGRHGSLLYPWLSSQFLFYTRRMDNVVCR
jgi:hypothetical protein